MQMRKAVFSAFLLTTSLYILLPTPDELIIYPVAGFFFSYFFHMNIVYGVLLAVILYRAIGVVCLIGALSVGGKLIRNVLREKISKKKF